MPCRSAGIGCGGLAIQQWPVGHLHVAKVSSDLLHGVGYCSGLGLAEVLQFISDLLHAVEVLQFSSDHLHGVGVLQMSSDHSTLCSSDHSTLCSSDHSTM